MGEAGGPEVLLPYCNLTFENLATLYFTELLNGTLPIYLQLIDNIKRKVF